MREPARGTWPYLAVYLALNVAAAIAYSAGAIGVPGIYGAIVVGGLISAFGVVRWEKRHYP